MASEGEKYVPTKKNQETEREHKVLLCWYELMVLVNYRDIAQDRILWYSPVSVFERGS